MVDEEKLDTVLCLITKIPNQSVVRKACRDTLNIPDEDIETIIAEARRRLTLAADFHRDEELGKAITRYDNIYSDSCKIKDFKTAKAAEDSRVKLLGLAKHTTKDTTETTADTGESETLTEIRNHLEPLGLAADGTPIAELARLAALKLTEK